MRSIDASESVSAVVAQHVAGSEIAIAVALVLLALAAITVVLVWATGLTLIVDAVAGARRRMLGVFLLEHLYALARMQVPLARGLGECASRMWMSSREDVTLITWKLNAGVPLGDALSLVNVEAPAGPTPPRRIISPAEAEILRVGESSGNLVEALRLVTQERRRSAEARSLVFAGFLYPMMVVIITAGIMSGLFVFITPKFRKMCEELSVAAPSLEAMDRYGWLWRAMPSAAFAVMLALLFLLFTPGLHRPLLRMRDHFSEKVRRLLGGLPFLGGGMQRAALAEFCYELAMLVRAEVPAPRALRMIAEGTLHPWLRERVLAAAEMAERGATLAQALDEAKVDPRAAWFARGMAGPEELSRALTRLGEDYSVQTTWVASFASQLLPPVAIMGVGVAVGAVVLGMFMPLLNMMKGLMEWAQ